MQYKVLFNIDSLKQNCLHFNVDVIIIQSGNQLCSAFSYERGHSLILTGPFWCGRQNYLMGKIQSMSRMRNSFFSLFCSTTTKFDTRFLYDCGDRSRARYYITLHGCDSN